MQICVIRLHSCNVKTQICVTPRQCVKYPLFHTPPFFNVDITFVSKLPSLLHSKIKNKHLFYAQKELCEGTLCNNF